MGVTGWSEIVVVGVAVLQVVLFEHVPHGRSELLRLGLGLQPSCLVLMELARGVGMFYGKFTKDACSMILLRLRQHIDE